MSDEDYFAGSGNYKRATDGKVADYGVNSPIAPTDNKDAVSQAERRAGQKIGQR